MICFESSFLQLKEGEPANVSVHNGDVIYTVKKSEQIMEWARRVLIW